MRALLAVSLLVLITGSGCQMCGCPYDYCGPVIEDDCAYGGPQSAPMSGEMNEYDHAAPAMQKSGQPVPAMPTPAAPNSMTPPPNSTPPSASPAAARPASPTAPIRTGARSYNSRFAYGYPNAPQRSSPQLQNDQQ
ncbi:MAG TPA: hypothetical protein VGI75_04860 [Pirellulales bacterium]|jgi:hypothetical protein